MNSITAQDKDRWITVKPNGAGNKGRPALIDENGTVKAGMGGKFNGRKISEAKSKGTGSSQGKTDSKGASPMSKGRASGVKKSTPTSSSGSKAQSPTESGGTYVSGRQAQSASKLDMTPEERQSMKEYTGAMYRTVNSALRSGKPIPRGDRKDVERMDRAFARASTKEPMTVYRGISKDFSDKLLEGATFKDPGFSSSTSNKNTAEAFSHFSGSKGAVMEIRVPKGSKAISLENISAFGGATSNASSEGEILLNRGGTYRVVKVIPGTRTRTQKIIVEYQNE